MGRVGGWVGKWRRRQAARGQESSELQRPEGAARQASSCTTSNTTHRAGSRTTPQVTRQGEYKQSPPAHLQLLAEQVQQGDD